MSVRPRGYNWLPLGRFSWNLSTFWKICPEISRFIKVWQKMGTSHEHPRTFVISRWILFKLRSALDKSCRENQNMHVMFNNIFCRKSCLLWDKVENSCRAGQATDDNVIWSISLSGWMTKATVTHTECVIFIAVPLLQCLHERNLMFNICGKKLYSHTQLYKQLWRLAWRWLCICAETCS